MQITNIDECLKYRLLRKISPDKLKSNRSMEIAIQRLSQAKIALKNNLFNFAIMESYMAMFHSARSLLYKDGIQEKSHYAISIYLKEKYSKVIPIPIINLLEIHRSQRHESMYGLDFIPDKEDADLAINDAINFVNAVKPILDK